MTNTSKAPERIWAWDDVTPRDKDKSWSAYDAGTGSTEYVRRDIFDAMKARAERAEAEADKWMERAMDDCGEGLGLKAENERLREALAWYGEQARLARLIHSEGDAGRRNLDADGGSRARDALRSTREDNK